MGVSEQVGCIEKIGDGLMESTGRNEIDVRREFLEQNRRLGPTASANSTRVFRDLRTHKVGVGNVRGETLKLVARKNIPANSEPEVGRKALLDADTALAVPTRQKAGGVPMIAPNTF